MQAIGQIKFVQVQQQSLKTIRDGIRVFEPAPLRQVDHLRIANAGIIGILQDGSEIIDAHHNQHPASRFRGDNGISIGFTSHYHAMRDRFGAHLTDGIAGENIIIEADRPFTPQTLGKTIIFKNGDTLLQCSVVGKIDPCNEFSQFCAINPISGSALKATLQFLDNGQRGFLLALPEPGIVRPGDQVFMV